ncbi:prolipoprotein signal peptidase II [Campylobacter blaseri]|uniref:Lipoprotein signal peptidase n=1 Tax=Campylobacter blaseri TaxID=2042961 RepID=A0A2P8R3B9_9BACT|nr:signal peptidase II [Campylobacter blaseri]PSM52992.1 signal peptidase II [Campylobacter blaseri]PSM54459.1 signal peptidase II [Campylobacter blaseri]QKF85297.1 prolipoprotein signal peptidase II [Campylobacter blaseri]
MIKSLVKFVAIFIAVMVLDQAIKQIFIDGFRWNGEYFSLILTYNKGVAFSMFEFLGENLKFLQLILIVVLFLYLIFQKELFKNHLIAFSLLIGAGSSNLLDRFIHGGVVDYVFWHKWFEFAVFNFADVIINFAVFLIILQFFLENKRLKKSK